MTRIEVAVTDEPINLGALIATVRADGDGAIASFLGVVRAYNDGRQVLRLDYEAYVAMAEAQMRLIAERMGGTYDLGGITILHRVGSLAVGEASVAVVVAAPHRDAAFDACREAMEMLKRDVPVWKREHHPDGARWVDARRLEDEHV